MFQWLIIGAIVLFGFKKGLYILAKGFGEGLLIVIGALAIGMILLNCVGKMVSG